MAKPTAVALSTQTEIIVLIRAIGEIENVPPSQLDPIIQRAIDDLEGK